MSLCPKCGAQLMDNEQFCYQCGTKTEQAQFCTACGAMLREGAGFCSVCGTPRYRQTENAIPIEQSKVSNAWVWTLATAPLSVNILLGDYLWVTIIIIVLNCVFLALDIKELEKSGNKPGSWIWLGFILVPVYLFMRASKMGGKYGYAITWCGLFVLSLLI